MINIIPKDKHDFNVCKNLDKCTQNKILDNIDELLSWTEDINWPIARCILSKLTKLDSDILGNAIENILKGDDSLWKYSLIEGLLPELNANQFKKLIPILEAICQNPSKSDKQEELDILIGELLSNKKL